MPANTQGRNSSSHMLLLSLLQPHGNCCWRRKKREWLPSLPASVLQQNPPHTRPHTSLHSGSCTALCSGEPEIELCESHCRLLVTIFTSPFPTHPFPCFITPSLFLPSPLRLIFKSSALPICVCRGKKWWSKKEKRRSAVGSVPQKESNLPSPFTQLMTRKVLIDWPLSQWVNSAGKYSSETAQALMLLLPVSVFEQC